MSKVLSIVWFAPLLYVVFFFLYWVPIYQNELLSFDEFVLEKQVNYAADAAVEELLNTGNLDQDYHNLDKTDPSYTDIDTSSIINVEPDLAVKEYASMLCSNWQMSPTEYNINIVKNEYIKALLVCAYDGVYAYWKQPIGDGVYEFISTPKIPYFYTENEGTSNQIQYCLTLGLDYGYSDAVDASGNYSLKKFNKIHVPKDTQRTAINNQVAELLNYALCESYSTGGYAKRYEIPALGSTIKGQQPVSGITVLGVVEGQGTSLASPITAECIGGARVTTADKIIGYTFTHYGGVAHEVKYYASTKTWKTLKENGFIGPADYTYDESTAVIFNNVFEAAKAGYNDIIFGLEGSWRDD